MLLTCCCFSLTLDFVGSDQTLATYPKNDLDVKIFCQAQSYEYKYYNLVIP
jgi:hypothetical protein